MHTTNFRTDPSFIKCWLIRRREALVYNTPAGHVTRDVREGIAKLGGLRFRVLDSAGLETAATSGTILSRTAEMTVNVLSRSQFAIFLIDVRFQRSHSWSIVPLSHPWSALVLLMTASLYLVRMMAVWNCGV